MIIDLKETFLNGKSLDISLHCADIKAETLALREDMYNCNILVSGKAEKSYEDVFITLNIRLEFDCQCDVCASSIHRDLEYSFKDIVKNSNAYHNACSNINSDHIVCCNYKFDLNAAVREYIILNFPMRLTCKEDCLGICQSCGNNLNERECVCTERKIDPRLSALTSLLD